MEIESIVNKQTTDYSQLSFFDGNWYLQVNHDVRDAGIDPVFHYLDSGWKEGRMPCPGFSGLVRCHFPDVNLQKEDPLCMWDAIQTQKPLEFARFVSNCLLISRNYRILCGSSLWDEEYYQKNNHDLRESNIDLALHYLLNGFSEGRSPSPEYASLKADGHFKDCAAGMCPVIWHEVERESRDSEAATALSHLQTSTTQMIVDTEIARRMMASSLISHVSFPAIGSLLRTPGINFEDVIRLAYLEWPAENRKRLLSFRLKTEKMKFGLDAAYWSMAAELGLTKEEMARLKKAEWNTWTALLKPDSEFLELYSAAAASGKRILIIDNSMFSAAELSALLINNALSSIASIYTFIDSGRVKPGGSLFMHALECERISPANLLHTGSNLHEDYYAPLSRDIASFYIARKPAISVPQSDVNLPEKLLLGYASSRKESANPYLALLHLGCSLAIAEMARKAGVGAYFFKDAGEYCFFAYNTYNQEMGFPEARILPFLYSNLEFVSLSGMADALQALTGWTISSAMKKILGADFNLAQFLPLRFHCYIIDETSLPVLLGELQPHLQTLEKRLMERQNLAVAEITSSLPEGKGLAFSACCNMKAAQMLEKISGGRFTLASPASINNTPTPIQDHDARLMDSLLSSVSLTHIKASEDTVRAAIRKFCIGFFKIYQRFLQRAGTPDPYRLLEAFLRDLRLQGVDNLEAYENYCLPDRLHSDRITTLKTILSLALAEPDPFAGTGFTRKPAYIKSPPARFAGASYPGTIGIHLHLHHHFLAQEMLAFLNSFPYRFDLFITTSNASANIGVLFNKATLPLTGKVEISKAPNRGRDIAPWVLGMRQIQDCYDFFAHIHGKVSSYCEYGAQWRRYLLGALLSPDQARAVFDCFYLDKDIGVMFPEPMPRLVEELSLRQSPMLTYNIQFGIIRNLLDRMGITQPYLLSDLFYSLGSMYWYRPEGVRQLFSFPLSIEEFPEEPFPIDQTIAHAIERIFPFIAQCNGFKALAYNFS